MFKNFILIIVAQVSLATRANALPQALLDEKAKSSFTWGSLFDFLVGLFQTYAFLAGVLIIVLTIFGLLYLNDIKKGKR